LRGLCTAQVTVKELSCRLGISRDLLVYHVNQSKIPCTERNARGNRYWTPEQADAIVAGWKR
jgi:DNA-binding transcriptional MerR regulator